MDDKLHTGIILYIIVMICFVNIKPSFLFDENGNLHRDNFRAPIIMVFLSVIIYYIVSLR